MKLMIRPSRLLRVVSMSNHISPWHLGQVKEYRLRGFPTFRVDRNPSLTRLTEPSHNY